jgi:multidrug transporter EmrE-like cation transporter
MRSGYFYIAATVILTVYGNLVFKWRVSNAGEFPVGGVLDRAKFLAGILLDGWIITAYAAAFLASVTWIGALRHFELSFAYPFMSLSFALVLFFSVIVFQEALTIAKVVGIGLIVLGIIIGSR